MRSDRIRALAVLLAVTAGLLGGSGAGRAQTRPLPPGHPPIGDSGGPRAVPGPPPGRGREGLIWKSPPGWAEETPSSSMRRAQYRIPGPGGPGGRPAPAGLRLRPHRPS
jgi:hypothetical protein